MKLSAVLINKKETYILDENLNNSFISGNKIRKIQGIIETQENNILGLLSFGSPYSSHILACAWWARKITIPFKGIVITDEPIETKDFPHLKMAENLNADLVFTTSKDADKTIDYWQKYLSNYLWIPGGAHTLEAANTYERLFDKLFRKDNALQGIETIILPYGTGTTAYGIWKSVRKNNLDIKVIGVSVSRCKDKCYGAISSLEGIKDFPGLTIIDKFSGRYGEIDKKTIQYRWQFFGETGILPDPIYNARSVQYFYESKLEKTLVINTGGMLNNLL